MKSLFVFAIGTSKESTLVVEERAKAQNVGRAYASEMRRSCSKAIDDYNSA